MRYRLLLLVCVTSALLAGCEQQTLRVEAYVDEEEWMPEYEPEPEEPPPQVIGIEIATMPDTTYYALNEPFDPAGLTLNVLYDNGTTKPYDGEFTLIKTPMTDLGGTFPAFDVKAAVDGVEYTLPEPLPSIAVSHDTKKLTGMTIKKYPKQTYYLGERFDLSGMTVTATFVDTKDSTTSEKSDFPITAADVRGYDRFKRGTQAVTVKVNNATLEIPVTVLLPALAAGNILVNYRVGVTNQNTYIKPVHIKGKDFDFNRSRIKVTLKLDGGVSVVLSAADGLLPNEIQGFEKNTAGAQTLRVKLENNTDKDIPFVVDVVDVEPAVWFDYGYMRHSGDPEGKGPGAGKYYAQPKEKLVLAPIRFLIGYDDDPAIPDFNTVCNRDIGAQYAWEVVSGSANYTLTPSPANASDNDVNNDSAGSTCAFTPGSAGTYRIKVTVTGKSYITGETVNRSAETDVECYSGQFAKSKAFTSPLRNYSPGQFTEAGTGYGWSLGTFGGYVVWRTGEYKEIYTIPGNAFGGWSEPGIVWFQEDRNGNDIPDEMWYESLGSDDVNPANGYAYKKQISRHYAVTYILLLGVGGEPVVNEYGQVIRKVGWVDCKGRTGIIPGGWPKVWGVTGNRVTYTGTHIRDTGEIATGAYGTGNLGGYIDTVSDYGKWRASPYFESVAVSDAAYADGSPVTLSNVRFIKVQTAAFRYAGIFGEISTEISSANGLGLLSQLPKPPRENF